MLGYKVGDVANSDGNCGLFYFILVSPRVVESNLWRNLKH
jgi:hypothetical protein